MMYDLYGSVEYVKQYNIRVCFHCLPFEASERDTIHKSTSASGFFFVVVCGFVFDLIALRCTSYFFPFFLLVVVVE